ncbi:MAG: hypothetical protein JO199_04880 [Candidatus Eremiobacteraeota bacterium]|nr:hypothetical protein [Candidatus Eremiobacteraeota bacterium]
MKRAWVFLLCAFSAGCAAVGTRTVPPGEPAMPQREAPSTSAYRVIYSFNGKKDARALVGGLAVSHGVLYGAAQQGGELGYGAVFGVTTQGKETALASLSAAETDPVGGPAILGTTLYGGVWGGTNSGSEIYAGPLHGTLKIVHVNTLADLSEPGQAVALGGAIYGMLTGGVGGVFRYTPSGKYEVIHKFDQYLHDGVDPSYYLTAANGVLYGATCFGGDHDQGIVFSLSPSGSYKVIYAFKGGADGECPEGALTYSDGKLYGSTSGSAAPPSQPSGPAVGTLFSVTLAGKEAVIYRFKGVPNNDCQYFFTSLVVVKGDVYGVCYSGGYQNNGLLFRVTPSGKETILHAFAGGADGSAPQTIVRLGNSLYGITNGGNGTVFSYAL